MATPLRGRRAAKQTNNNGSSVASLLVNNNNGGNGNSGVASMNTITRGVASIQSGGVGAAGIAVVGSNKRASLITAGDNNTTTTTASNNNNIGVGPSASRMPSLPPPRAPRPRVSRSSQLEPLGARPNGGNGSGSGNNGSGENSKAHSRQQSSSSSGDGELKEWNGNNSNTNNTSSTSTSSNNGNNGNGRGNGVAISAAEKQMHDQLDTAIAALQVRPRPLAVQARHMSAITTGVEKPPPHLRAASTISVSSHHGSNNNNNNNNGVGHTSLAIGGAITVGSSSTSSLTPQRLTPSRKDGTSASAPQLGVVTTISSGTSSSTPTAASMASLSSFANNNNNNTTNGITNNGGSITPPSYTPPSTAPAGMGSFGLNLGFGGGIGGNGEKRSIPRLNFADIPAQSPPSPLPIAPTGPAPVATVYSYSAQGGQPTIVATGEARQAVIARAESPSALQWKQHVAAEEAAAAAAANRDGNGNGGGNGSGSNSRSNTPPRTGRRASSANPGKRMSGDPSFMASLMSTPANARNPNNNRKSSKNMKPPSSAGAPVMMPIVPGSSSATPNAAGARGSTFTFASLPTLSATTNGTRQSISNTGGAPAISPMAGIMGSPPTPSTRAGGWLPAESPAARKANLTRDSQSRGRPSATPSAASANQRGQFSSVVRLDDSIDGLTATVAGALARASGAPGGGLVGDRYSQISINGSQVGIERDRNNLGGGNTVTIGGRRGDYELVPNNSMTSNDVPSPSHGRRARPTQDDNTSSTSTSTNGTRVPSAGVARNGSFGGVGTPSAAAAAVDGEVAAVNNGTTGNGWILDVGVAMDPNPRYRPTMEDAHVVIIGFGQTIGDSRGASPAQRNATLASGRRRATNTMVTRKTSIDGGGRDDVKSGKGGALRAGGAVVAGSGAALVPPSASPSSSSNNNNNNNGAPAGGFFAIFDGHGGRACVDFVEKTLHRELEKSLASAPVQRAIELAFMATDDQMAKAAKYQECGSTACVAYIRPTPNGGRELYVANVGDAQAVLATSTTAASPPGSPLPPAVMSVTAAAAAAAMAAQSVAGLSLFSNGASLSVNGLTNGTGNNITPRPGASSMSISTSSSSSTTNNSNHSPSSSPGSSSSSTPKKASSPPQWLSDPNAPRLKAIRASYAHVASDPREQARVKQAGGRIFMGRVNGSLAVSRAFGDHGLKKSGVTALPYQMRVPLTADVKFVIIGCDGVWDVMNEKEAVDTVSGMRDASAMAKRLVDMAMDRGTTDNVSCMVIRLQD